MIRKIIAEVGLAGIVRIPTILMSLAANKIRTKIYVKRNLHKLNKSIEILKTKTVEDFGFYPLNDEVALTSYLNYSHTVHADKLFYQNIEAASKIATSKLSDADIERVKEMLPNDRDDFYYRSHNLNNGKNDHWEYYLVPWLRSIQWFSYLLLDSRFKEHLLPIYEKYKKWYRDDSIWFLTANTNSNIYACEAGRALHCLHEFLIDNNTDALGRYKKHLLNVKHFINKHFDNGIPMEGNIYGRFLLVPVIHLDWMHRKLGLPSVILSDTFIQNYVKYIKCSYTKTHGFETSGDSKQEIDTIEERNVYKYIGRLTEHSIFNSVFDKYKGQLQDDRHLIIDKSVDVNSYNNNICDIVAKNKGQYIIKFGNADAENILVFHSNRLVPVVDTLHFGIKPGHFFLYSGTKKEWIVTDPGYVNYFRPDNNTIKQTEYNTLASHNLFSKGILLTNRKGNIVTLTSFSLLPFHIRRLRLNTDTSTITVNDYFLGLKSIYVNADTLTKKKKWFKQVLSINCQ